MTAVGKILVFFNLLLSLAVGWFCIQLYVTRTRWAMEYDDLAKRYEVAQASRDASAGEIKSIQAKCDGEVAIERDLRKKAEADYVTLATANRDLSAKVLTASKESQAHGALAEMSQAEVSKRQKDYEMLKATLAKETDENIKLVKERNELLQRTVAAEIQFRSIKDVMLRLEERYQEAMREMVKLKANGATAVANRTGDRNPPVESVEGLIKNTDPRSGLVTITLGSDAGLTKGNTMEVFRLSPSPKYLGTIRILEVTATQAVGAPTGRMTAPPKPGDRVASRILGG